MWPEDDLVYAPCDGKVTVTMGHAVGLQSDSGIEVLVQVGVDTVNMNGDGFEGFVKADDVVSKLWHPKDVQGWSGFPATFFIASRGSVLLHVGRACKPFGR